MGVFIQLYGVTPPARTDGNAFTEYRIDEAPSQNGPWSSIDGPDALSPVDTNPAAPLPRNISTENGTLDDGWYRVAFIDEIGGFAVTDPVNAAQSEITGLATVADVRRALALRNPAVVDDDTLKYYLNVAASWLEPKIPPYDTASGTSVFYNANREGLLYLPVSSAQVTAVRGYDDNTASATVMSAAKWDYVAEDGAVRLLRGALGNLQDPRYFTPPLDTLTTQWARVEVDWVNSADVPWAVREGVALFAAALYQTNSKLTGGMRSERIGDYSYTLNDKDADDVMPQRARKLLKPYMRKRRIFVT